MVGHAQLVEQARAEHLAVHHEMAGVLLSALPHEVLQVDDLRVALAAAAVVEHAQLVLAQVVGNDADAGVGVNDGAVAGHYVLVKEVVQAEAVHVAHEEAVEGGG